MSNEQVFEFKAIGVDNVVGAYRRIEASQKLLEDALKKAAAVLATQVTATRQLAIANQELAKSNIAADGSVKSTQVEIAKQIAAESRLLQSVQATNAAYRDRASAAAQTPKVQELAKETGNTAGFSDSQVAGLGAAAVSLGAGQVAGNALRATAQRATEAFKVSADFDKQIRTFGVVAQATEAQTAALEEEVLRLGQATTKTPQEVGAAAIALAKLGFSGEQTTKALEGVVQSSTASGESVEETAKVIGLALTQFQLPARESQKVADLLTQASNTSATGTLQIGESLKYVGGQAKESGQSLEETIKTLALMAAAGLDSSSAGTGLAEALKRIKLTSASATTELGELKSRGSKQAIAAFKLLNQEVRGADGQLLPFATQVLPKLKASLESFDQPTKELITNQLFGVQGSRAVLAVIGQTTEAIEKSNKTIDEFNGSSAKASEALTKGSSGAIEQFTGSLGNLTIAAGKTAAIAYVPLLNAGTALINGFLALDKNVQKIIITIGGLGFAASAGALALVAFNIANNSIVGTVVRSAAALVSQTAATAANAVATNFATGARKLHTAALSEGGLAQAAETLFTKAATAGKNLYALAVGRATAANVGMVSSTVLLARNLAITALAAYSVSTALSRFEDGGKAFNESADKVEQKLRDLRTEAGKTKNDLKDTLPSEPPPTDFVDGAVDGLNKLQRAVNEATGAPDDFSLIPTNAEKQVNDATIAVERLGNASQDAIQYAGELSGKFKTGVKPSAEEVAKGQDALSTALEEVNNRINGLSAAKLGTTAYDRLKSSLQGTKAELESAQTKFTGLVDAANKSADGIRNNSKSLIQNAKDTKSALEAIDTTKQAFELGTISPDTAIKQLETIKNNANLGVEAQKKAAQEIEAIYKDASTKIVAALDLGQISSEQAISQLEAIKNGQSATIEARRNASNEIVKIRKDQSDAEIATIQASQAKIEALQASGRLGEAAADKQLTDLKLQEIQKRIEANRVAIDNSTSETEKTKLLAEESKLQTELSKVREDFSKREKERKLKGFDERRAILDTELAQGKVSQEAFNQQSTKLDLARNDEQLKQQRESLSRLAAGDKEGREAINAEIAKTLKARTEIQKAAYDREVALIEQASGRAADAIKASETERLTQLQSLQNQGLLNQQEVESARIDATRDRIDAEYQAELDKLNKLKALPSSTDPATQDAQQNALRDQTQRLADLNLQRLQTEGQAQENLRAIVLKRLQDENAARKRNADLAVASLEKEAAGIDVITKSLERQNQLIQARGNLQKAVSDAALSAANIELTNIQRARQIREQLDSDQTQSAQVRAALERELASLGFDSSATRLQLLQAQQTKESEIAAQKQAALLAEQEQARISLELELKRNDLAARRALIEAQIAETKARQGVSDAQATLKEAQITAQKTGDNAPVANAQTGLQLAQQLQGFASEGVSGAKENIAAQAEIAVLEKKRLETQQASALAESTAAEKGRLHAQVLEYANVEAAGLAANLERAASASDRLQNPVIGGKLPGRRDGGTVERGKAYVVGEEAPEIFVANANGAILNKQQIIRNLDTLFNVSGFKLPNTSIALPSVAVQPNSSSSSLPVMDELLRETKALNKVMNTIDKTMGTIASRPQKIEMPVKFEEADTPSWDRYLKLQRSLLRGQF